MNDSPRRRSTDRVANSPTLVGAGATLTGGIECEGDLIVSGNVVGDSVVRGSCTLVAGARWEGRLRAREAVIAGEWLGDIEVAEKLEIRKSARIRGSVAARNIAIARGAQIDGNVAVTSGAAVVHFDEKRGA
jgi:cytoskeletal protein CcmA (bactofilin family)